MPHAICDMSDARHTAQNNQDLEECGRPDGCGGCCQVCDRARIRTEVNALRLALFRNMKRTA